MLLTSVHVERKPIAPPVKGPCRPKCNPHPVHTSILHVSYRRFIMEQMMNSVFHLRPCRAHEVQGSGRIFFALWQAQRYESAVWISPDLASEIPLAPSVTFVKAAGVDILWAAEEALRGLPHALVIAQPEAPLSLTAGRRFQLAAEAVGTTGLLLVRPGAGSPATETRWDCEALPSPDSTLHRWSLIKNKNGTCGEWTLNWDGTSASLHMLSATGQ